MITGFDFLQKKRLSGGFSMKSASSSYKDGAHPASTVACLHGKTALPSPISKNLPFQSYLLSIVNKQLRLFLANFEYCLLINQRFPFTNTRFSGLTLEIVVRFLFLNPLSYSHRPEQQPDY